jgi:prolyl 4-hydroxylase
VRTANNNAVALASQHDAAGRHDDAINALAVGAKSGDVDAMTELGKRLISGDRAPYLPRDGAGLLAEAVRAGGAEAALRCACLSALGAHVEQSWQTALNLAGRAAVLGSETARGQLRVLAARNVDLARDEDWQEFARGIDIGGWLASQQSTTLHEAPLVRHYSAFLGDAACRWLTERARHRLRRAMIYSGTEAGDIKHEMRTNSAAVMHLGSIDLVNVVVQYRIAAACGVPVDNLEGPTVLHYAVGEEITDHTDFINPRTRNYEKEIATRGERFYTCLVYLNDDYDGGETDFPLLKVRHKARRGDGLLFSNALPTGPPDPRSVHAGMPPTRGEKWLLSQFVRSRAVFNTPAENVA